MTSSRTPLHRIVHAIEQVWDGIRRRARRPPRELTIITYLAHGSTEEVVVRGRVLAGRPVAAATEHERLGPRVKRMASRFMTSELPGVCLMIRLGGDSVEVVTDEEGYFVGELSHLSLAPEPRRRSLTVEVRGSWAHLRVHAGEPEAVIVAPDAERLLISDIDDTVLLTNATNRFRTVLTTLTGSAWTRSGFDGAAELYRGLVASPTDDELPCCYVSSSPWNLYDFLVAFLDRAGLPSGPIFLRDYGIDEDRFITGDHHDHKSAAIDELLRVHAAPVVLSGDTGEHDPEIFRDVIRRHGDRVAGVLLREVGAAARSDEVRAMFDGLPTPLCLGADSAELAIAAEDVGLVPPGWAERVSRAR
ncbi:MAG: phosphatase domain-containing protein [Actinomycetota bacterium]